MEVLTYNLVVLLYSFNELWNKVIFLNMYGVVVSFFPSCTTF